VSHQALLLKIDAIKAEVDQHRPLDLHAQKELKEYFRIGLTYTSNALEGNSLTETETKIIIEDGITIGGKTLREHFEAVGHSDAYTFMLRLAANNTITEQEILELHKLFYARIDATNAGAYRTQPVYISGTDVVLPPPSKVPKLMQEFANNITQLQKEYHPVEYAALLHLKLVQIHPFIDGNGRTARLLMNLALLQAGYFVAIIPPIIRREYHASIRASSNKDTSPFISFITQMVYESGKDYQRMIKHLTTY
jgi:Fic family protein